MIREIAKKLFNDEAGVSPIVATLVLIVVAIAGAAAVGTIMGSFSSDVSDSSSSSNAQSAASTELLLDGSSTVYPVSVDLAEKFMQANPGIRVDVTSSSSGTGITATGLDLVDIGASSRALKATEQKKYDNIKVHQIGASAVVMVANPATAFTASNISKTEAAKVYTLASGEKVHITSAATGISATAPTGTGDFTVVKRVGDSGTQDTFVGYVGIPEADIEGDVIKAKALDGNKAVAEYIKTTPNTIGFIDYGFAEAYGLTIVDIDAVDGTTTKKNVIAAINGDTSSPFKSALTRPLNYLTNGNPSSVEQAFIDFAKNPVNAKLFENNGYFAIVTINE